MYNKESNERNRILNILMVEDNPGDVRLMSEAMEENSFFHNICIAADGAAALAILRKEGEYSAAERPDLVILDLNLPRRSGLEVLEEIKKDSELKRIPVTIFSTSSADPDIARAYELGANCFMIKPSDFDGFLDSMRIFGEFWFVTASLPAD